MTDKRLLVLGGMALSCEIVEQAHRMGHIVYVTDYLPDSPAKKTADKSFMVSTTDVDAVVKLIEDEHIDGVITGYVDLLLPYYVEICRRAGLPCYATEEQIAITTDKEKFKKLCLEYNVPVVPEYKYEDVINGNVKYPILVKPVDNSGARGIHICHNRDEFDRYHELSMAFSTSGKVLIERYMQGREATIFYYFHKGEIFLMGMGDRHMIQFDDEHIPLPTGYTFPAATVQSFLQKEHHSICNMFRGLGMKEGMAFIQTFIEGDECIIYEMGYRLTGSIEHHLFEHAYNFNTLGAIIDFALGNETDTSALKDYDVTDCCMANLTLLLKAGYLEEYKGLEKVSSLPGVLHTLCSYKPHTQIDAKIMGTLAQVALRTLLYADNRENLLKKMDVIKSMIEVVDSEGHNILIDNYSYSDLI